MNAIVPAGATALMPTNIESAIRLAEMMARGKLVPVHLQGSPGDCLMVIEVSMRWGMSPFAVAQCTSVIQGKLMFEGKLVGAALNTSGIMASRLDYEFSGANGQRAVTVRGTLRGETKTRDVTVHLADAKTTNGMWVKQPDQQLVYAATRVWARRHAPEVMLGVYAPEEFDRADAFDGPTIDATSEAASERAAINAAVPMRAAAAATPRAPSVASKERTDEQWHAWLAKLRAACTVLRTRDEVVEVAGKSTVGDALATGPGFVQREISAILAESYARFPEADEAEPEEVDDFPGLPDVEIKGAEKLMAG